MTRKGLKFKKKKKKSTNQPTNQPLSRVKVTMNENPHIP